MDPNIGKVTGKERTVAPCKESLPTSCGPHRKRFLEQLTLVKLIKLKRTQSVCTEKERKTKTKREKNREKTMFFFFS